ncbi:MAG TPA: hypothetical protein VK124_00245 [Gemmatimonadales bacterium]|nr:hypothetical protein [Gemmatimonadales bacterium]
MLNFRIVLCGATIGLTACGNLLVNDVTDPDRNRVLGTPADVESFIGATYAQIQNATLGGSNDDIQTQMQVMGMENVSGLANFAMGPRGAVPRNPIDNTRGSQGNAGNVRDFQVLHRAARMATIGIARLKDSINPISLGSPARNARALAFARFTQGVALGNLALVYDSAAILTEHDNPQATIKLSDYRAVMTAALGYIDSAIAIWSAPVPAGPAADWLPSPATATWINGQNLTAPLLMQLARSYKARLRAGVARNPAERAAVDWASVIADATAGITADFNIGTNPAAGWDVVWPIQAFATGSANWHQMSQFWLGMADSSGGYDNWLNTPRANRVPFLVVTADHRFPIGTTRTAQSGVAVAGTFTSLPYVRNRPAGEDQPGDALQISQYDFYRSRQFFLAGRIGTYPVMTRAEIRLLAAEGRIRTGTPALAMALIDSSRTAAGLPALVTAGITDTIAAAPGGAGCVPRVPDKATGYKSTKCGNAWDALKWEYRMETMYTGYGMWYLASRGWGDLPEGTAVSWPVPYQEMDARAQPFYGLGGVGQLGGSGPGNYGLYNGGVY